jgi:hypothetical protein
MTILREKCKDCVRRGTKSEMENTFWMEYLF